MDEEYVDLHQERFIYLRSLAILHQGQEALRISRLSPEDLEKELMATVDRWKKTYPEGFKKAFPDDLHLGIDGLDLGLSA